MSKRHTGLKASAAVLAFATVANWAGAAGAQTIQTVVVTAQKTEQNLQKVPVAVTAFGAADLAKNSIINLKEIAQRTPGFTASEVSPAEPNYYIRGIGTEGIDSNAAGDPSVAMFIDGVYVARGGGSNLDLFDLERVEVLRGPQGTLFGKNAAGGLIQIVSRKPSNENWLAVEGTIGDYSRIDLKGSMNAILDDGVYASAAVLSKQRDGFMSNETTGNDVDDENSVGARAALRFTPNDNLDIVISADVTRTREKGRPRDNVCDASVAGGSHCVGVNPDPHVVNSVTDGHLERDVWGGLVEINWQTDIGTITSLTAYRSAEFDFEDAFFSNPVNPPAQIESINRNVEESTQFSQELRLAFDAFDGRLNGVLGAYYLDAQINRIEILDQRFPVPAATGVAWFPQDVDSTSSALFAQANFEIVPDLTLTAGARVTWESKDAHLQGFKVSGPGNPPPLATPFDIRASESWTAFTPKFGIEWQVTDAAMLYASAARGFKSGGFQGTPGNGASAAIPYNPEYLWSYEIGAKTLWFDDKFRLNVSAFHIDHEDLQVSSLVPLCCVVIGNAAAAEIDGVELEFLALLAEGLEVNGSYSYLDAEFVDFTTGATADYTGNTLPRSPKNKLNLGAQYTFPIENLGEGSIRVDWTTQSKIYFEASNTPLEVQKGYELLDARAGISNEDDSWEVFIWGKNLTDELIKTHIVAFAPYAQILNLYQPPRTYGLTVRWRR